jgi:hypothetical protein
MQPGNMANRVIYPVYPVGVPRHPCHPWCVAGWLAQCW